MMGRGVPLPTGGNPFRTNEPELAGTALTTDNNEIRLLDRGLRLDLAAHPAFVEAIADDIARSYSRQPQWHPNPIDDWRLGALIQWFSENGVITPTRVSSALAYALGVSAYALRRIAAYKALLLEAQRSVAGPLATVAEIAAYAGISERTLYGWRKLFEYSTLLGHAKELMKCNAATIVGPGGLPYIGDEWLDPTRRGNWQVKVDQVAHEIIARVTNERRRYPAAELRKSAYTMVQWHAAHGRVLSSTAVKSVIYALGLMNPTTGVLKVRRAAVRKREAMTKVALEHALAEAFGRSPASVRKLSKLTGASQPAIHHWLSSSTDYDLELARIRTIVEAHAAGRVT